MPNYSVNLHIAEGLQADIELLIQTMSVYTEDMPEYLQKALERMGCTVIVDKHDNVIGYKGDKINAPLLIAHTDTVFNDPPWSLHVLNKYLVGFDDAMKQCGIGADDRAGVAAILQLIPHLDDVTVLFPALEEAGCIGSKNLDIDMIQDSSIAIQIDRRIKSTTESDAIFHTNGCNICSMEFKDHIKPVLRAYGFKLRRGVYTDIGELKLNGLKCSALNLSAGYTREHSSGEILHIPSYERTLNLTLALIQHCKGKSFPYKSKSEYKKHSGRRYFDDKYYDDYEFDKKKGTWVKTARRGKATTKNSYRSWWDKDEHYADKYTPYCDDFSDEVAMVDRCDMCGNERQLFYRAQGKDVCYVCRECIAAYKL